MKLLNLSAVIGLTALLSACGSSPDQIPGIKVTPSPPVGEIVDGIFYNVNMASKVDGENIAITFFEPTTIEGGKTYPLIMNSHGFGGSRTSSPNGFITRLRDADYAVLTLDQRGHGDSGGQIEALNPEKEGKDMSQALDWVEENVPWIRYEHSDVTGSDNLVLGTYGSSYGGGFQHTILSWDEKQRLDAMVPDITWHHLTYAFAPNLVLKSAWVSLLAAGGSAAGDGGNLAPWITQAYVEATTTNSVSDEIIEEYFDKYGMNNYCVIDRPHKVDALYSQGVRDVLFNMNEMYRNYQCVSALGGDVRMISHESGHILPGLQTGGQYTCGDINYNDAIFDWFEEKIMGKATTADYIPELCYSLADGDAEHLGAMQVGHPSDEVHNITVTNFVQGSGGPGGADTPPTAVEIGTADGSLMLAGIPTISVDMSVPIVGGDGAGDPRVFIGIGIQKGGAGDWLLVDDQVAPFRGYEVDVDELVGIGQRLEAGDKYGLLFYAFEQFFTTSAARDSEPAVDVSVSVELPLIPDPTFVP